MGRTVQADEWAPGLIRSVTFIPGAPGLAPANLSYLQVFVAGIIEVAW